MSHDDKFSYEPNIIVKRKKKLLSSFVYPGPEICLNNYIPSSSSICCLMTTWSNVVRYSSPGGHPGTACGGGAHCWTWYPVISYVM